MINMEVQKLLDLTGLSQKELADKVGIPAPRISEYVNGKYRIRLDRLKEWCEILKIDIKKVI